MKKGNRTERNKKESILKCYKIDKMGDNIC